MIALLPVRFSSNPDPSTVWPDATFQNWLNPSLPYSLAHYWWTSSWGYFDLRSQIFPTLVMNDPRPAVDVPSRPILVNGVIAQATAAFDPPWDQFDIVLIWGAQRTDMFGGGAYQVPLKGGGSKTVAAAVVDVGSPFDGICQELGHAFGLQHEIDVGRAEYMDPYSIMSARRYADNQPDWFRAVDPNLPDGNALNSASDRFNQLPAGRIVGPTVTPAQLFQFPWFESSAHVVTVPATFRQTPVTMKLYALDHARAMTPDAVLPALAVIDPGGVTSFWFTFELRRQGAGYEQGIGDNNPPAGIVMHAIGTDGRVRYEGVLPLAAGDGDRDWRNARYTVRIVEVGPDDEWVTFMVMNGPFAAQRGVSLDSPLEQAGATRGPAVGVFVNEPCLEGSYTFQRIATDYRWSVFAQSYGFDDPKYRWFINGVALDNAATSYQSLPLGVEATIPAEPTSAAGTEHTAITVTPQYRVTGNRLDVVLANAPGNFTLTVRAVAYSTNPLNPVEVVDERYISATCVRYEWDEAYRRRLAHCFGWMDDVVDLEYPPILVDPGDPVFHVGVEEVADVYRVTRAIVGLREREPERAEQLIDYMRLRFNVPRADLDARLDPQRTYSGMGQPK